VAIKRKIKKASGGQEKLLRESLSKRLKDDASMPVRRCPYSMTGKKAVYFKQRAREARKRTPKNSHQREFRAPSSGVELFGIGDRKPSPREKKGSKGRTVGGIREGRVGRSVLWEKRELVRPHPSKGECNVFTPAGAARASTKQQKGEKCSNSPNGK